MWGKNDLFLPVADLHGTDTALRTEPPWFWPYFQPGPHVVPSQSSDCLYITVSPWSIFCKVKRQHTYTWF